jgi:hypothetical protein
MALMKLFGSYLAKSASGHRSQLHAATACLSPHIDCVVRHESVTSADQANGLKEVYPNSRRYTSNTGKLVICGSGYANPYYLKPRPSDILAPGWRMIWSKAIAASSGL